MRVKQIASSSEIVAHRILRRTLADSRWLLSANVSIQSVLEREERLSRAAFSMFTRGSFDFVVYDGEDYVPAFVLEVDGVGHEDSRQIARDLLKNAFCARAGLSLLRIGANDLRERDENSVLEWLVGALVAFDRELEEELDTLDVAESDDQDDEADNYSDEPPEDYVPALGEDGFAFEAEHPFPDNAVVATRLQQRYGIALVDSAALNPPADTGYVLSISWIGRQPPRFREGRVSRFVVSEKDFTLFRPGQSSEPVFSGVGRAEFAFEHKMPAGARVQPSGASRNFPWDPWGVAAELALYDALRQVERWARSGRVRIARENA